MVIFSNLSTANIAALKIGLDNVSWILAFFSPIMRTTTVTILALIVIETTVLRYLIEFVWRRVPSINDAFLVNFIIIFNLMIAALVSLAKYGTGENEEVMARLQGIDAAMIQSPSLQFKYAAYS